MRKRIGIFGATDEALALVPLLSANPGIEIVHVYDAAPENALERAAHDPGVAALLEQTLTDDASVLAYDDSLAAVIGADPDVDFAERFPEAAERGVQVVTPLAARMLWGYATSAPTAPRPAGAEEVVARPEPPSPPPPPPLDERKSELLQVLSEVVESYNLTVDTDELFTRMLEIAVGVTEAEGGSLMLLDRGSGELRVRVAIGVEPELWPKIRVPLGDGIAGRVAQEGRSLRLRGQADRHRFHIVRERLDVESALCVPLIHGDGVLGVLNLHTSARSDAFSEDDLEFAEELAHLDAQIIARAQEHEVLRTQSSRYEAVRQVREVMASDAPLPDRLDAFCRLVAEKVDGIATVYQLDPSERALRMAATSMPGGVAGADFRIPVGQGIDGAVAQRGEPTFLHQDGSGVYAALPLSASGTLAGVLSIQTGTGGPSGRAAEETLLEMAAAAADELVHAEREHAIAERANKASAINEAGIRMISSTEPAEVLRLGTSEATLVLEADHAVLRLQDEETRRFVIRSYFGSAEGPLQEKLFRLDKLVSVDALKRRSASRIDDIAADARLAAAGFDGKSLMSAPLQRDGRVIGTLAVYDKIGGDRIYPGAFSDQDLELFKRFVGYLERAVANAHFYTRARQFRNFDEETGLPNAAYLHKRIQEEIARAGSRDGAVALAAARIENLEEIEHQGDPVKIQRIVARLVSALQSRTRDFDVLGRAADDEFILLLPEPGRSASDRAFEIARAVAEDVSKDERLNDPVRICLAFGYASLPEDGSDADSLLSRAREPRIRMV
jgi:GAF domain-containing protein